MANQFNSAYNEKHSLSSTQPMFNPNPNFPLESAPSAPPPAYTNPSQFPSPTGMLCLQYYPPPTQGMSYPQPYVLPPAGHPYYPQPGDVYPEQSDTKYPAAHMQQQQQQQQQLAMTNNMPAGTTPLVVDNGPPVSMVGAFVLSCIVYFCAGWVCGAMAFGLAIAGRSKAASGNRRAAIHLRNASYCLSIFGIVVALTLVGIYLAVFLSPGFSSDPWLISMFPKYNASYYDNHQY